MVKAVMNSILCWGSERRGQQFEIVVCSVERVVRRREVGAKGSVRGVVRRGMISCFC
jgi:hypothetical protein